MEAKDNQELAGDSEIRAGGWSQMFSRFQDRNGQPPEGRSWWVSGEGGGQRERPCRPTNLSYGPVFQDFSHRLLPH